VAQVALSYHGAAMPRLFDVRPGWYENPILGVLEPGPPPRRGWFFVSATNRSGLFVAGDRYGWLRGLEPDAVVGGTIHAFDLDRLAGRQAPPGP
jgi:hypothetical protein